MFERIRPARMRADRDALGMCHAYRPVHRGRISGVKAAGNIRRRHVVQDLRIVSHPVSAETLAHIAIQIYAVHHFSRFSWLIECRSRCSSCSRTWHSCCATSSEMTEKHKRSGGSTVSYTHLRAHET